MRVDARPEGPPALERRRTTRGKGVMSLRRQFIIVLVTFSVVLAVVGGSGTWLIVRADLEAEMDEKLRQVTGTAARVGFSTSGIATLQPGDEQLRTYTSQQSKLRQLQSYVAEAWIVRTADYTSVVSTRPATEMPIGSLTRFEAYGAEIGEAERLSTATTSDLFSVDEQPYKYGFIGLGGQNPGLVLAVRMRADYLIPLDLLKDRLLWGALVATSVAILLALFLSRNVARPLERLSRVALRIQRGRWAEPVGEEKGRELRRLSSAMERMREGIVRRDEHLRLMLAQVAHEIRNPLGGLELFAAAVADAESSEERNRLVGRIRSEVQALNVIIHDFLTFARPLDPNVVMHDLCEPVREAVELVALESGDECSLEVDLPSEPLVAHADPDHVKRVTLNLLRNAAQAADNVKLSCESHRGEVRVIVADDGPGIPKELRDRIFEPFVSDKEQGAGLGLAIVKKLVTANGGRVTLFTADGATDGDSLGTGAEFRVYFSGSEDFPLPSMSPAE